MRPYRVAAFQRRPIFDNVPRTLECIHADLTWCAAQDVELAVFPECYLQGYDRNPDVLKSRALSLIEPAFQEMVESMVVFNTTIVLGLIEQEAGRLFNTAAVIRAGQLLGTYRKTHPNERAFEAGQDYPVFGTGPVPFGVNICNDANFPEAAQCLSDRGAAVICMPLNNMLPPETAERWRGKSPENLRQRAMESGCWIVSSDVVGEHAGLMSFGCTCIVNPAGQVVAHVPETEEGIALWTLT